MTGRHGIIYLIVLGVEPQNRTLVREDYNRIFYMLS